MFSKTFFVKNEKIDKFDLNHHRYISSTISFGYFKAFFLKITMLKRFYGAKHCLLICKNISQVDTNPWWLVQVSFLYDNLYWNKYGCSFFFLTYCTYMCLYPFCIIYIHKICIRIYIYSFNSAERILLFLSPNLPEIFDCYQHFLNEAKSKFIDSTDERNFSIWTTAAFTVDLFYYLSTWV